VISSKRKRRREMKKSIKILSVVIGLIVVGVVVFSVVPITSSKLKDLVLTKLEPMAGREVTIERVRIILLRGVRLDGVAVANRTGFTGEPLFRGRSIMVNYKLLPLLRKELVITKVLLLEPQILLERNRTGEWNFAGIGVNKTVASEPVPQPLPEGKEEAPKQAIALTISQVAIKNGRITLEDRSKSALRSLTATLDLTSSIEMKEGLLSRGKISLSEIAAQMNPSGTKPLAIAKLEIPYEFANNLVTIENLLGVLCQGELKMEAKIDLEKIKYNLKIKTVDMELNELLSSLTTMKDMVYGTIVSDLEVVTGGRDLIGNMTGGGLIKLSRGKVRGLPLQKKLLASLSAALSQPSLAEVPYNSLGGHFKVKNNKVKTEDFELDSDLMKITAQGIYSLAGRCDFDIMVKTTPKLVDPADIPSQLRDKDGNASLPFELSGTVQNPKFQPKWEEVVKKAIENILEEELRRALGKD
jgi:uncharacterized protein involved in outer membrane biogenesis